MIMRRFTVATLVLAGGLLTACDGDSTGNGGASIFGTYTLVTFDGEALPVDFGGIELSAGSIELKGDGTYIISLTVDLGSGPEMSIQPGEFTVDPLEFDDFTGSISGNTLTLVNSAGNILVFTKQGA